MNWSVVIVLTLLIGYIVSETMGSSIQEGFAVARRADIGYAADGWEEGGAYKRDLRYTEAFVDIQGIGVATDFCRAIYKTKDPESLRISCALGRRDGMDTMEYNSRTKGEGFRFSRDDYWRSSLNPNSKRMDYCRILKDADTGEWFSGCAVAGLEGFKRQEERDAEPPTAILSLLEAYEGILVWFRWQDDRMDYAQNAAVAVHGTPIWPVVLKPERTRGLQLNRWPAAAQAAGEPAPPLRDYLRWGETGTFELHQAISPRQIRAFAFWIWWDGFEKEATVFECKNPNASVGKMDRVALGIEGGGVELPSAERESMLIFEPKDVAGCSGSPPQPRRQAEEVRPEVLQAIGQLTEPATWYRKPVVSKGATYFFEIWDNEHRIMRLDGPMGAAKVGEWQHVAVTVTDATAWWPTWQMWINGALVGEKSDGRLSPAIELKENYIGKNVRGCMQDFRMYSTPLTPDKLKATIAWAKPKLHPLP